MLAELQRKVATSSRNYNDDFQKPRFGKNMAGEAVQLKEMTYHEVLLRMVELMFITARGVWIDKSLQTLTGDFIRRVEERFATKTGSGFVLSDWRRP